MKKNKISRIFSFKNLCYSLPFFIVIISVFSSYLAPEDLGHYIRMGEEILKARTVISKDIFTHTFLGMEYINAGWLSQVVLAVFNDLGGKEILILLNSFILVISLYLFVKLMAEIGINYKIIFLFSFLYMFTGASNWNLRPQLFVIPIFIYYFSFFYSGQKIKNSHLFLFFMLMVLWVNFHNSFPAGIGLLGIFLVAGIIKKYLESGEFTAVLKDRRIQTVFLILIAVTLATFLNPYGFRIWGNVFSVMDKAAYRSEEWLPPTFNTPTGSMFFLSLVSGFAILLKSRQKLKVEEIILLIFFCYQSLRHVRMVLWWGIVATPIFARHFQAIVKDCTKNNKFNFLTAEDENSIYKTYINGFIILCLSGILLIVSPYQRRKFTESDFKYFINPAEQPVKIIDYLNENNIKGNMFNYSDWGSYIIWELWPEYSPFFATRMHIVPREIWNDYLIVHNGKVGWEDVLEKYNISLVLLNNNENSYVIEVMRNSGNWQEILSDPAGILFSNQLQAGEK